MLRPRPRPRHRRRRPRRRAVRPPPAAAPFPTLPNHSSSLPRPHTPATGCPPPSPPGLAAHTPPPPPGLPPPPVIPLTPPAMEPAPSNPEPEPRTLIWRSSPIPASQSWSRVTFLLFYLSALVKKKQRGSLLRSRLFPFVSSGSPKISIASNIKSN
uniref:Uncharacterized protein n=1 Tax=Setaria viridis TaxID=4556 RepID=A0A4V6DAX2_SETVI|nr:hypothetical protein SEVIR_2G111200v2 [Setaria viridis]TKW31517.1 hypothetical protein SEVIR_2G111200v2 [Setaria viridis]